MINIFANAKYIFHIKEKEISTIHLRKLCYYCQAWHLVWRGTPLFLEDFEGWDDGPVCRELFDMHRGTPLSLDAVSFVMNMFLVAVRPSASMHDRKIGPGKKMFAARGALIPELR
jgi:uncharacterized phage-associated protein